MARPRLGTKGKMTDRQSREAKKVAREEAYKVYNGMQENQYHSLNTSTTSSTTPTFNAFTNIAQGDTNLTRDGNEILIKRVRLNFSMAAADTTNIIRLILFYWNNDTTPAVEDLFIDGAGDVNSTLLNHNQNARILFDKRIALSSTGANNVVLFSYDKKYKKGVKVEYNSSTSTDVHRNSLHLMNVSDSGAATHPALAWRGTIEFND